MENEHDAPAPQSLGCHTPGPHGWLIREADGGWCWTNARIAAVAALTEGYQVVNLAKCANTVTSKPDVGNLIGAADQSVTVPMGCVAEHLVDELRNAANGLVSLKNDRGDLGYFESLADRLEAIFASGVGRPETVGGAVARLHDQLLAWDRGQIEHFHYVGFTDDIRCVLERAAISRATQVQS